MKELGVFQCRICGEELDSLCEDCYVEDQTGKKITTDEQALRSAFNELLGECRLAGTHLAFYAVVVHLADAHREIIRRWPHADTQTGKNTVALQ